MLRGLSISVLQVEFLQANGNFRGDFVSAVLQHAVCTNGPIEDRRNTTDLDFQKVTPVFGQAQKTFALNPKPLPPNRPYALNLY